MPKPRPSRDLTLAQRRAAVARMILAGVAYREIAAHLGVSLATVAADKAAIIADLRDQYAVDVSAQVMLDLARLDGMIARLEVEIATTNDLPRATTAYVAVLKRRAAILGYDAADRRESGLRLIPQDVEAVDDHDLAFDSQGRPIGKGDAARIYAAFAVDPDTADLPALPPP